jgi:cardiolipin synthase
VIRPQENPGPAVRKTPPSPFRHLPNLITALRMLLVVPLCWLLGARRYDDALLVAAIAAASDAVDGFLARRFGWRTWIGGMLDPIADKLLLTAAFVWLALTAQLPPWLVVLVVGRDLAIVAGAVAYHNLIGRFDAEPSRLSKLTTAVQLGFVLIELLRLSHWIELPATAQVALIALTALVTLASGLQYIVVWSARARRELAARREPRT